MDGVTPQDLKARLDRNDRPLLLDVRQDWETRLCRLDNSVHIPIEEIELRAGELNSDDEIVVYCHQGVRSAAVADYLRQLGFKNVKNLVGGLDHWARTVDPTMRRY
jgi:adenylyltransferase/sulfurtransferase